MEQVDYRKELDAAAKKGNKEAVRNLLFNLFEEYCEKSKLDKLDESVMNRIFDEEYKILKKGFIEGFGERPEWNEEMIEEHALKKAFLRTRIELGKKLGHDKISGQEWEDENVMKNLVEAKELQRLALPETRWLVDKLILEGNANLITGDSGCGKTNLVVEIAKKVTTGEKVFDKFETKEAAVLYIDEENGEQYFNERLKKFSDTPTKNIELMILRDYKVDDHEKLITESTWFHRLNKVLNDMKKKYDDKHILIILDSLSATMTGDENSVKDARKVRNTIKNLLQRHPNTTWIVLHHTRKTGSNKPSKQDSRGSGDIVAFFRNQLTTWEDNKDSDIKHIEQTKNNLAKKLPEFNIRFVDYDDEQTSESRLKLEFEGWASEQKEANSTDNEIANVLELWFVEKGIKSFRSANASAEIKRHLKEEHPSDPEKWKDGKVNYRRKIALPLLVDQGIIKEVKRGEYCVLESSSKLEGDEEE